MHALAAARLGSRLEVVRELIRFLLHIGSGLLLIKPRRGACGMKQISSRLSGAFQLRSLRSPSSSSSAHDAPLVFEACGATLIKTPSLAKMHSNRTNHYCDDFKGPIVSQTQTQLASEAVHSVCMHAESSLTEQECISLVPAQPLVIEGHSTDLPVQEDAVDESLTRVMVIGEISARSTIV